MVLRGKAFWLHLAALLLAALLFLFAGWMFVDAWLAFTEPVVIIEWQTASEMNTLGFNIFRSDSEDGAQEIQINADLIPPASDPLLGGSYTYNDEGVRPGSVYYYWLEEVDTSGLESRYALGPVEALHGGWQQGILGLALLGVAYLVLASGAHKPQVSAETRQ
jgi:hypothetical protein